MRTSRARLVPYLSLAVLALVIVACAGACGSVPSAGATLVGKEAPWFRLVGIDGVETTLDDVRGERATLIDFWATWCQPCIAELPHLEKIANRYRPRGLSVVGVLLDENAEELAPQFLEANGVTYPNLIGDVEVETAYEVLSFPTHVLLDANGTVIDVSRRALDDRELEQWLEQVMGPAAEEGA